MATVTDNLRSAILDDNVRQVEEICRNYNIKSFKFEYLQWSALNLAAWYDKPNVAAYLVQSKAFNIDELDEKGWTALHWAANHESVNTVRRLIGMGANQNIRTRDGDRAIDVTNRDATAELFSGYIKGQMAYDKRAAVEARIANNNKPNTMIQQHFMQQHLMQQQPASAYGAVNGYNQQFFSVAEQSDAGEQGFDDLGRTQSIRSSKQQPSSAIPVWTIVCKCGVPLKPVLPPAGLLRGITKDTTVEWGIRRGELLPAALVMDLHTGAISGCPVEVTQKTEYSVEITEVNQVPPLLVSGAPESRVNGLYFAQNHECYEQNTGDRLVLVKEGARWQVMMPRGSVSRRVWGDKGAYFTSSNLIYVSTDCEDCTLALWTDPWVEPHMAIMDDYFENDVQSMVVRCADTVLEIRGAPDGRVNGEYCLAVEGHYKHRSGEFILVPDGSRWLVDTLTPRRSVYVGVGNGDPLRARWSMPSTNQMVGTQLLDAMRAHVPYSSENGHHGASTDMDRLNQTQYVPTLRSAVTYTSSGPTSAQQLSQSVSRAPQKMNKPTPIGQKKMGSSPKKSRSDCDVEQPANEPLDHLHRHFHRRKLVITVESAPTKPCFSSQCIGELSVAVGTVFLRNLPSVAPVSFALPSALACFMPRMDYTKGGAVDTFTLVLSDTRLSGLSVDPKDGALLGWIMLDQAVALPTSCKCTIVAENAIGKTTFELTLKVVLMSHQVHSLLPAAAAACIATEGTCHHVLAAHSAFLSSLPSPEKRANVSAALEALKLGTFDFYSMRDQRDPASYDGMIFLDIAKGSTAAAPVGQAPILVAPELTAQRSTAELLYALACIQAYQSEGLATYLEEATEHFETHKLAVFGAADTPTTWEPLYLLVLARLLRCAQAPSVTTEHERLALQSQVLAMFQHFADGWVIKDDLRGFAALSEAPVHTAAATPIRDKKKANKDKDTEDLKGAEKEWSELMKRKEVAGNRKKLTAAAKELFGMVGLEAVKMQAVSVYCKVAMDLKLPAAARIGCTLNFSFMGNPGTGKTSVARIFGKLFHAMGARKSDTFIELKAQLALSQGEEAFSELLYFIMHPQEAAPHLPPPDDAAEDADESEPEDAHSELDNASDENEETLAEDEEVDFLERGMNMEVDKDPHVRRRLQHMEQAQRDQLAQQASRSGSSSAKLSTPTKSRPISNRQSFGSALSAATTTANTTATGNNGANNAGNNSTNNLSPAQKKALTLLKKALGRRPLSDFPGGVLFIDEAHMLDPAKSPVGRSIINSIIAAAEDHRDVLTIILAGYQKDIEQNLYAFDVGLKSRFSDVRFADYDFHELKLIWKRLLAKYSDVKSGVHWTCENLTTDIAVRRVARSIGRPGFGNGRDLRNAFERAASLAQSRKNFNPRRPEVVVEDVIGPPPDENHIPELRAALHDLEQLEGLEDVKKAVRQLVDLNKHNYFLEMNGQKILDNKKNRIFWGNPGTGKTTCAEIYGCILKALRLLSDGEVVLKTASDFIGSAVGESETKTAAIINLCQGKVLVIDECYNLDDNMYGKKVLDTLVEKVSGQGSEDIAVLLAGYEGPIRQMLRTQNPGLSSRFDPALAFVFADYSDLSLLRILRGKVTRAGLLMHPLVHHAAVKKLAEKRAMPRFGNAREVDNLVSLAQSRASTRPLAPGQLKLRIELEDICPPEEAAKDQQDAMSTLDGLYNIENIRTALEKMRRSVIDAANRGRPKPALEHMLFLGNSGTGKTTVARVMAQLLSAPPLQLLARNHVHVTTGTELKGAFVGKAQENVREAMGQAKGGILFIDEAYSLGDSMYGKDAINQLLAVSDGNPEYSSTVIIMAGYEENMHAMLNTNQGMKSRFSKVWRFADWTAEDCVGYCVKQSLKDGILLDPSGPACKELRDGFESLISFADVDSFTHITVQQPRPGWANARDVESIYKDMIFARSDRVFEEGKNETVPCFTAEDAATAIKGLLMHRPAGQSRSATLRAAAQQQYTNLQDDDFFPPMVQTEDMSQLPPPPVVRATVARHAQAVHPQVQELEDDEEPPNDRSALFAAAAIEDKNSAEWEALSLAEQEARCAECERDTQERLAAALQAAEEAERALQALLEQQRLDKLAREEQERREREEEERRRITEIERAAAEARRAEHAAAELRAQEAARLAAEAEQRRQEEVAKEQRAQQRIRQMGVCPQCFPWIKIPGGYVCGGGSHMLTDDQVGLL